ncbi:MAG: hypothetical protein JST92_19170 [Deltaproteobacteria bacterium]|nr:hypothetical protein [Deltaproteobacteria bacterium]
MSALMTKTGHLTETALQLLADGTLRGPEGMAARGHVESCEACQGELLVLAEMMSTLALLRDPPAPESFTGDVLQAVNVRETQLVARRHIKLAAIPAIAVGLVASLGWACSEGIVQRFNDLRASATVLRAVLDVAAPVIQVTRLPLAACAFALTGAILFALTRTLRHEPRASQAVIEA